MAAFRALTLRSSAVNFAARVFPPLEPGDPNDGNAYIFVVKDDSNLRAV